MAAVRRKIEKDRQDARWLRWTTRLTHTVSKRLSRPSQKDAESLRRSESREVHLRPAPCALRPPCVVPCALRYASPSLLSAPARGALRHVPCGMQLSSPLCSPPQPTPQPAPQPSPQPSPQPPPQPAQQPSPQRVESGGAAGVTLGPVSQSWERGANPSPCPNPCLDPDPSPNPNPGPSPNPNQ